MEILGPLLLLILLCGLGVWFLIQWRVRRRAQRMIIAFQNSVRGRVVLAQPLSSWGFTAHIEPAPEPFTHITITYRVRFHWGMLGWPGRALPKHDRLVLQGTLPTRPMQELQWVRGQIPARALGKAPDQILWLLHRLDFVQSEYVTRGTNPGGLQHSFGELQRRFEPLLYQFTVLAENKPHVVVALQGQKLNADEIAALMGIVRGAGRAALLA
jgi:hypothetical protein